MRKQRFTRVRRPHALLALAGLLVAVSAGAASTQATSRLTTPRTLYVEHGTIHKFAQDGDFMTWVGGRSYVVHLRGVSGGKSWVLGHAGPGGAVGAQSASSLVLGGKQAVWVKYAGVLTREAGIYTAKAGQKKPTLVDAPGVTEFGGTYLTGLAADGAQTIVYGEARVTCELATGCSSWSLEGGGVFRVSGTKGVHRQIVGVPPVFALSASVGRVAVVPAAVTDPAHGSWGAAQNGPVEVFDLAGNRRARVVPGGTVREVALSWPDLAVIVMRPDGTTVIEHYDAASGALLSSTRTPGATNLAIGAGGIVFLVGRSIYTLHDGQPMLLRRATMKPIGLSVEGRRVTWAACGRIKALTLPR